MRLHGLMLLALGLLASTAGADDGARAVIDAAIRAHGGETAIAKWPVVTAKTEGIFHGYDRTPVFFFTAELTHRGANQSRAVLDGKIELPDGKPEPQTFCLVNVLDGERGWVKMGGEDRELTRDFTSDELSDRRESAYVAWISTLLPLRSPKFTLTLTPVDPSDRSHSAVAIRVVHPGHRDVTLFFDQKTHLLVKTETRSRGGLGVEGKVETVLSQHKAFDGVQRPMILSMWHDGHSIITHWVRDYEVAREPEAGTFAKP